MEKQISLDSLAKKAAQLIARSEQRIDKTNAIVDRLATMASNLTRVYDEHLRELERSRNEIVQQNTKLMEMILAEQKRTNDILLIQERLISALAGHGSSSSTINIRDISPNQ